CQQFDSPPLTF
nr:immunoglobulin light chain junction region [Macaca mulatta]MOV77030.1 immunoglobulin light chain junction region [Macaca mulatta]